MAKKNEKFVHFASQVLSDAFIEATSELPRTEALRKSIQTLREQYLEIFALNKTVYDAVIALIEMAKKISEKLLERKEMKVLDEKTNPYKDMPICICGNKQVCNWNSSQKIITAGRFGAISYPQDELAISRIHMIILPLIQYGKIMFVDVGSINGFSMIKRSSGKCLESSLPEDRKVIVIDWDERVQFQLFGKYKLYVNPKECIVCMERPRCVYLDCSPGVKHYALCDICYLQLLKSENPMCPICRMPISQAKVGDVGEPNTLVNSTK